jgi:ribosomal protein S7
MKKNPGKDVGNTMAINNVKPMVEVKSIRVGGLTTVLQLRKCVRFKRWLLSIRWIKKLHASAAKISLQQQVG